MIDRFTQRAQGLSDNGTNIAVDQPVLTMYQDLTAMNIQLLKLIDDTQEKKGMRDCITFTWIWAEVKFSNVKSVPVETRSL